MPTSFFPRHCRTKLALLSLALGTASAFAQLSPAPGGIPVVPPAGLSITPFPGTIAAGSALTQPTLTPGQMQLIDLETEFAEAVAKGGGKAFATWFADDAVVLNNGKPAVLGRGNIASQASWDPAVYQLTWYAAGGQMGPSNDMGFTWGHYEGRSKDKNGQPVITSGRYFTVWKKTREGWKVAMDASADEPPASGECCTLPKP